MNAPLATLSRWTLLGLAFAAFTGCASVKLPAPSAGADNVQKLRAANLAPAGAGDFKPAAALPAAKDASQGGLRGSSVSAESGSFARYLRDTLVADLSAAGLYDERSLVRIEGELTETELDAAIGTGTGSLGARFKVMRGGKIVYDKTLRVSESWESSFVGAVALPLAINKYSAFYRALVGKLVDDAEFRAAMAR